MATTEALAGVVQRLLEPSREDFSALHQLVVASRWNQLPADWVLFLEAGSVHVVRDQAGRIIASGAVLPMGASAPDAGGSPADPVAWISMILVTPDRRGLGLGRAVFDRCLREVQAGGRIAMLDATPAGEALYTQFGFRPLWRLARWRREALRRAGHGEWTPAALVTLAALDARALGFDRHALLARIAARPRTRCLAAGEAVALLRDGRTARQLGPLHAADEADAADLLRQVAASEDAALLADVPDDRPLLRAALEAAGFREERRFARMALAAPAQVLPAGDTALIHAIAGPEYA